MASFQKIDWLGKNEELHKILKIKTFFCRRCENKFESERKRARFCIFCNKNELIPRVRKQNREFKNLISLDEFNKRIEKRRKIMD